MSNDLNIFVHAGPIIEQATHFCDLVRYLGGEVRSDSVTGCCVPYSSDPTSAGYLSAVPGNISEESLAPRQRIPRFTTGMFAENNVLLILAVSLFPEASCQEIKISMNEQL